MIKMVLVGIQFLLLLYIAVQLALLPKNDMYVPDKTCHTYYGGVYLEVCP